MDIIHTFVGIKGLPEGTPRADALWLVRAQEGLPCIALMHSGCHPNYISNLSRVFALAT